eukprot:gnl/MRDRNA2_/MRDRNA2_88717_c0_seq1.p1 gnl/MRDRNA2_/MRDRNA2_88717_c0~~gnl/MRDRNA2_/MRDRNA2_88717_c0_seq1.p1  ORF type:complete len:426 (+),score=114.07 gnl/MRDRNA2_/MRDRNA2_88717_c0_seq1:79-1356(+)
MQPVVAFIQLSLALFAVPANAGVYAPSLLTGDSDDAKQMIVFRVHQVVKGSPSSPQAASQPRRYDCQDDPSWVDEDGDGCAAYASAINSGHLSQEVACGFEQPLKNSMGVPAAEGDFEGAAFHCRATCGTCGEPPAALASGLSATTPEVSERDGECKDDATWTDDDGDGCDVYAMHIQSGQLPRSVACGFEDGAAHVESGDPHGAAQHCRATCGTCDVNFQADHEENNVMLNVAEQIVAESPEFDLAMLSSAEDEKTCKDDPNWADVDGDGCAEYANVIANGLATQEAACGRAHMELISGNPSEAAKYCPVTCGNCNLEAFQDNDADMKDMIRLLVEQESENILKSAYLQEEVEEREEAPEVTTTTTTAAKKLPEAECSTNSTWIEYWDPEADKNQKELSQMDLLKMASDMKPQQSRWLQMMSSH